MKQTSNIAGLLCLLVSNTSANPTSEANSQQYILQQPQTHDQTYDKLNSTIQNIQIQQNQEEGQCKSTHQDYHLYKRAARQKQKLKSRWDPYKWNFPKPNLKYNPRYLEETLNNKQQTAPTVVGDNVNKSTDKAPIEKKVVEPNNVDQKAKKNEVSNTSSAAVTDTKSDSSTVAEPASSTDTKPASSTDSTPDSSSDATPASSSDSKTNTSNTSKSANTVDVIPQIITDYDIYKQIKANKKLTEAERDTAFANIMEQKRIDAIQDPFTRMEVGDRISKHTRRYVRPQPVTHKNEYWNSKTQKTYEVLRFYYKPKDLYIDKGYYSNVYKQTYHDGYGYNFYNGKYQYYEYSRAPAELGVGSFELVQFILVFSGLVAFLVLYAAIYYYLETRIPNVSAEKDEK